MPTPSHEPRLVTVAAFLLFFAVITPQLIDRARSISLPGILGLARPTPTTALPATIGTAQRLRIL